ncbi:DUF3927 domain-containing protein [Escherichia coli]|nr:DUF3927 domain-containing protein [Escherichia coli]
MRWLLKKRTNGSVRYCQYTSDFTSRIMSVLADGVLVVGIVVVLFPLVKKEMSGS